MERPNRQKRVYYTAGLWNRAPVLGGAVLFLVAQVFWLIQLFTDAASRSAAGQAPPEGYTTGGIIGRALIILVIVFLLVLLIRQRRGTARLSRPKRYLLMSLLTVVWGMIHIVSRIMDIFVYPEFILFLDILMLAAALVAPVIMLQLADFRRERPEDTILLFIGIGGAAFSVISLLIYALVLKKSYSSFFRLAPELLFRVASCLFGVGGLLNAIKLRADYPIAEPLPREAPRERTRPVREPEDEAADGGWLSGFDEQTASAAYGDAPGRGPAQAPRSPASAAMDSPSAALLSAARRQLSLPEEPNMPAEPVQPAYEPPVERPRPRTERPPRPKNGQGTGAAAREINGEAALTRWQSKRMRRVNEFEEERWQRQQLERPPIAHPYADAQVRRVSCPDCGKRVPEDFPVCPRCGRPL